MKADLAIYSLVVGMSGLWVNVATMLNNKLDFYCCDNSVGFCKSSHILCICMISTEMACCVCTCHMYKGKQASEQEDEISLLISYGGA